MLTRYELRRESSPAKRQINGCFNCIYNNALNRYRRFLGSTCRRSFQLTSNSARWVIHRCPLGDIQHRPVAGETEAAMARCRECCGNAAGKLFCSSTVRIPFACVVAHDRNFHRWTTALNVKRLLPPGRAGGPPVEVNRRGRPAAVVRLTNEGTSFLPVPVRCGTAG